MKLKLWSIQEANKIDEINSTGKLVCTENKFSIDWDNEYKWMMNEMEKRIGSPDLDHQYPIWAWYQHQDINNRRPDLRRSGHLPNGTSGIRIEFEKNSEEVLLSDFVLWHFPLSYKSIIAENEFENDQFELKLDRLKLDKTEFKDLPAQIQLEIENSWHRIFDMEYENEYYTNPKNDKMIQACCWEIKQEEIVKIDKFTAR